MYKEYILQELLKLNIQNKILNYIIFDLTYKNMIFSYKIWLSLNQNPNKMFDHMF